jgi:nicotinate-nucleotide adenylyltransferase
VIPIAPITPVPLAPLTRHVIVFGGTFDPPHQGHVQLTAAAREAVDRDASLLFVPAAVSPFKVGLAGTPAVHRVAMLRLAIAALPRASVWTDEVDRAAIAPGPSFTIDTIARLQTQVPRTRITLLVGADQAAGFHRWRDASLLLPHVRVLLRDPLPDVPSLLAALEVTGAWTADQLADWRTRVLSLPQALHLAQSTAIRARIRESGLAAVPRDWLHAEVAQYIHEHDLYQDGAAPA